MSIAAKVKRLANALYWKGFDGEGHWRAIFLKVAAHQVAFRLREVREEKDGILQMDLFIATNQHKNGLHVDSVVARWQPHFSITSAVINGVDTTDLAQRMDKINWKDDHQAGIQAYYDGNVNDSSLHRILRDLTRIGEGSEENAHVRDQFIYRYLQGTGIEWFIDCHRLHRRFECRATFTEEEGIPTPSEISLELQRRFRRIEIRRINKLRRAKNPNAQLKRKS